MKYILLFPGLALYSFNLLLLGGVSFPLEIEVLGRRIHELESLTISGGKSLSNLVEIFLAIILGLLACGMLYFKWPKRCSLGFWQVVGFSYLVVTLIYLFTPALPE